MTGVLDLLHCNCIKYEHQLFHKNTSKLKKGGKMFSDPFWSTIINIWVKDMIFPIELQPIRLHNSKYWWITCMQIKTYRALSIHKGVCTLWCKVNNIGQTGKLTWTRIQTYLSIFVNSTYCLIWWYIKHDQVCKTLFKQYMKRQRYQYYIIHLRYLNQWS